MATQGVAQPSTKKRSFLLRDFFKICRSVSRVLPREKPNHKQERKLHTESKRHEAHKSNVVSNDPNAFNFQEAKANKVEGGASIRKVRSYNRLDNVGHKKPLSFSRSYSHNTATAAASVTRQSSSYIGRSRSSSNRTDSAGFRPTLMRSPRSFANPILYSTSSEKVAKPQPTEKKLICTLEELCKGCTKKIKIKRDVTSTSGQVREEEETVEIKVKPGWKGGTKVTFQGKGNEAMRNVPADLTFVVVEKEHEVFKRKGDDLEMAVEVTLLEALTGFELCVALPDGENMSLKIEDVIHPGYVRIIHGKGMPKPKEKGKTRGDLRVRFRAKFPERLTDAQRSEIQSILQNDS